MADPNTEAVKADLRRARANLRDHFAELDHHLHVDIPRRIAEKVLIVAAGTAAVGALIAMAGFLKRRRQRSAMKKKARTPKRSRK